MRKIIPIVIAIFVYTNSFAQQEAWIIGPVKLFDKADTTASNKGILLRGAYIKKINDAENGWQKIEVYKGLEGYVPSSFLVNGLNMADKYLPSPEPIIEEDDDYGSPHLFAIVASLKARTEPNVFSKISKIYTNGEPIAVYYYPVNDTDWVVTSTYSDIEFVQKKFIGKRSNINDLFKKYDGILELDITNRKIYAERILELAWKQKGDLLPALLRYLSVAKDLKNQKLIDDTELNIIVAKAQTQKLSTKKIGAIVNSKSTYAIIKNTKITEQGITLKKLNKLLGKPEKRILKECSGNTLHTFFNAAFEVFEKDICYLDKMYFKDSDCYYLNGYKIDKTLTEKEFVLKYANIISVEGDSPHEYFIDYDEENSQVRVQFKGGKIERIVWFTFDC